MRLFFNFSINISMLYCIY